MNDTPAIQTFPAPWEKRNLGLDAVEIEVLSDSASLEEIQRSSLGFELATVKVPNGNLALVHALEANGFRFLESQFSISLELSSLPAQCPLHDKILRNYVLSPVSSNEVGRLQKFVNRGLFTTDRIALDPELGLDLANRRYNHWIADMAASQADSLQWIMTAAEPSRHAGFMMFQEDGQTINALLGGIFPQFQKRGAGLAMAVRPPHHFAAKGFAHYRTKVSSNNVPILRLYQSVGFRINEIVYVLRRLESRNSEHAIQRKNSTREPV
ncbi:MAG: hypothetical protein GY768_26490 [Planctomycetaceae bacterium]|nr:hypothetical protein [Planctomycetaceae bacterium]